MTPQLEYRLVDFHISDDDDGEVGELEVEGEEEEEGWAEPDAIPLGNGVGFRGNRDQRNTENSCQCGCCPNVGAGLCCREIAEVAKLFMEFEGVECITQAQDFSSAILNPTTLKLAWRHFTARAFNARNDEYQYAAYHQFGSWCCAEDISVQLPACVEAIIKNKFPVDDNNYRVPIHVCPTELITSFADAEQPTSSSISEESRLSEGSITDLPYRDEILGHCVEKESQIGSGSYGEVFKATLVVCKKAYPIAVKKYRNSNKNENNWREIKKGPKTNSCPHIVKILGYIKTPPQLSIVMELMTYGSLSDFTKKYYKMPSEIPPWAQIVEIIYDVIQGMDFLHTLQNLIIHRDLKLDNVLITNGFKCKIGDLGLATTPSVSKSDSEGPGTQLYLPPERWSDSKRGYIEDKKDGMKKYDIYAFGVTAWTFLSGVRPYLGRDCRELPAIKLRGESPDPKLEMIPTDTPPIIKDIITDSWNAINTRRPEFSELARRCKEARDAYSDEDREVARTEMQNRCNRIDGDGTGEERIPSLESSLASLGLR